MFLASTFVLTWFYLMTTQDHVYSCKDTCGGSLANSIRPTFTHTDPTDGLGECGTLCHGVRRPLLFRLNSIIRLLNYMTRLLIHTESRTSDGAGFNVDWLMTLIGVHLMALPRRFGESSLALNLLWRIGWPLNWTEITSDTTQSGIHWKCMTRGTSYWQCLRRCQNTTFISKDTWWGYAKTSVLIGCYLDGRESRRSSKWNMQTWFHQEHPTQFCSSSSRNWNFTSIQVITATQSKSVPSYSICWNNMQPTNNKVNPGRESNV